MKILDEEVIIEEINIWKQQQKITQTVSANHLMVRKRQAIMHKRQKKNYAKNVKTILNCVPSL